MIFSLKFSINMQKLLLAIFAMATLILASCTSTVLDDSVIEQKHQTQVNLLLDFTTSEAAWSTRATDPESATVPDGFPSGPSSFATRALTATASEVSRIALTIFDAAGNKAVEKSQYKTDDDFGTFTDLRLLPGTYTFAIVAHRAATTDEAPATITSATSATLPGTFLLDTYATTQSVTVTANATQNVSITVPLCVTKLNLVTLDKLPSDATFIRITTIPEGATVPDPVGELAESTPSGTTTFNPTTGLLPSAASFTRTWNVSASVGMTLSMSFFFMAEAYPLTTSILAEALDAEGTTIASRTFTDITFNRAKVRTINTYLFSGTTSTTLTFEEWTNEDPITIE